MTRLVFSLTVLCLVLACPLATPAATPVPSTATPMATKTPTATPTPDVVSLPDARTFAGFVAAEGKTIIRYAPSLGVERGTKIYFKYEDVEGLHLAVFGDAGGKWGLLEVRELTPTPAPTATATPWDGAEGARR